MQDTERTASLHFANLPQARDLAHIITRIVLVLVLVFTAESTAINDNTVSGLFKAFTVGHSGARTDARQSKIILESGALATAPHSQYMGFALTLWSAGDVEVGNDWLVFGDVADGRLEAREELHQRPGTRNNSVPQ